MVAVLYFADLKQENKEKKESDENTENFNNFKSTEIKEVEYVRPPLNVSIPNFQQVDKSVKNVAAKGDFEVPKFSNVSILSANQTGIDTSGNPKYESFIGFNRSQMNKEAYEIEQNGDVEDEATQGLLTRGAYNRFQPIEPRVSTFDRLHGASKPRLTKTEPRETTFQRLNKHRE